jgi:molybdenum cofactor guanylyltransferase
MAQSDLQISAIVLAGGLSSRMGQDKALIAIDGVPLLLRVCQIAQQCVGRVYVVTPWGERYRALLNHLEPPIQLIQEVPLPTESLTQTATHGPLVGFLQGLSQLELSDSQSDWVLLLACDLPNLHVDILQQWLTKLPHTSTETVALLPRNPQGWWEPLCGFYRAGCRSSLAAYVQDGKRSFQQWLAGQVVEELPLLDSKVLFNCNTPDELRQVQ